MRASWSMLLDGLDSLGSAREVAPGEIEVRLTQGGVMRRIVVLMTAAEWDEMASVMWGDADDALADVKRTVSSLGLEFPFAVYGDYELEPSMTRVRQDGLLDNDVVLKARGTLVRVPARPRRRAVT